MSMLNLFRHSKRTPSPSLSPTSLPRPASCVTMHNDSDESDDLWLEKKPQHHALKRCATTTARTTSTRGWGIVPVLNELERRSSTHSLLSRRSPSAQQLLCLNCRRLYFPSDSRCTPQTAQDSSAGTTSSTPRSAQFCSLDCKSSYACSASTQDLVDLELHAHSATSSDEDTAVVTVDDDTDFSF